MKTINMPNCWYCGGQRHGEDCVDPKCMVEQNIRKLKVDGDPYGLLPLLEQVKEKLVRDHQSIN